MYEPNRLYHCLRDVFKPYEDLFNLHRSLPSPIFLKPFGCSMYICSSRLPWRKVVFTSIFSKCISMLTIRANNSLIEACLTTRLKISSLSIPFYCEYTFATRRALNFSPSFSVTVRFLLYTHLKKLLSFLVSFEQDLMSHSFSRT